MDFDSSSKFISSLAKFLQSLCNGYVEFDNGVEVIGHIYLNVDTGKKIDYILNEKVCKTDENSVTFISNSFHAQPAEKPKPVEKPKQNLPSAEPETDEILLVEEPDKSYDKSYDQYSEHVQHNSAPHPKSKRPHGASKRSYSLSFSSNRPSPKTPKFDSSSNPNGAHLPSNNSTNDSSFNLNMHGNITAASESDLSHLSQVFPENVNDSSNTQDIKPVLDKDLNVINVKQEYDPAMDGQGEGNTYDEGNGGFYPHDQSYDESGNEQYYGGGHQDPSQRSDYDQLGSKMYMGEAGSSVGAGDTQGTTRRNKKVFDKSKALWRPGEPCPVYGCFSVINHTRYYRHWREQHERIVSKYLCPYCTAKFKRREKLVRHSQARHGVVVERQDQVEVKEVNCQFIDPTPLNLPIILGAEPI